jgi:hypothetical protein
VSPAVQELVRAKAKGPLSCTDQDNDKQSVVTVTGTGAVIAVSGGHTLYIPPNTFPDQTTISLEVTDDSLAFNISASQAAVGSEPMQLIALLEDCGQGKPFNAKLGAKIGSKKLTGQGHSGNDPSLAVVIFVPPSNIKSSAVGPRAESGWIFIGD